MLHFEFIDNSVCAKLPDGQPFWTLYPVELSPGYVSHNIRWERDDNLQSYYQPLHYYRERSLSQSHLPHDIAHCIVLNVRPSPTDRMLVRSEKEAILINEPQYFGAFLAAIIKPYDGGYYYDIDQRNSFHTDAIKYERLHQALLIINAILTSYGQKGLSILELSEILQRGLDVFGPSDLTAASSQISMQDIIRHLPPEQWGSESMNIDYHETGLFM